MASRAKAFFQRVWGQATPCQIPGVASCAPGRDKHLVARPRTVLDTHQAICGHPKRPVNAQPHTTAAGQALTAEEHIRVQKRIEARAYAKWVASGCRNATALRDWVEAEEEVLVEFCRRRMRPAARGGASCGTRGKPVAGSASKRRPTPAYSRTEESTALLQGNEL